MATKKAKRGKEYIALRESLGLTQTAFWGMLGITQSAGSRYENGRYIPKPVQTLIHLMFVIGLTPRQKAALEQ